MEADKCTFWVSDSVGLQPPTASDLQQRRTSNSDSIGPQPPTASDLRQHRTSDSVGPREFFFGPTFDLEHYYSESCNLIGQLEVTWLLAGHVEVTTYRFTYALRGSKPIYSYLHVTCGL